MHHLHQKMKKIPPCNTVANTIQCEEVAAAATQHVDGSTYEEIAAAQNQQEHESEATNFLDLNMDYQPDPDCDVYADHVNVVFEEEELDVSSDEYINSPGLQESQVTQNRRQNLSNEQRKRIYKALLSRSLNGNSRKNSTTIVVGLFNVKRTLVQSIWRVAQNCINNGILVDVSSKRGKFCGRKKVDINLALVATLALNKRTTIRHVAYELHCKKSTLHRLFKEGKLQRHSNTLKPLLSDANK